MLITKKILKIFPIFIILVLIFSLNFNICATNAQGTDTILTEIIKPVFNYDLYFGLTGEDVFKLQKFLNADENTALAFSGFGSRGYETQTFGLLTKNAVISFQNKYKILPADGYVGQNTRQKINEMYSKTDFNKIYTKINTNNTNTNSATSANISTNTNTTLKTNDLCQFINTLISNKTIPTENVEQTKIAFADCFKTAVSSQTNTATFNNTTNTTTLYNPAVLYTRYSSSTTPTQNLNQTYNYYNTSSVSVYNPQTTTLQTNTIFEGHRSLGLARPFAVLAGEDIININTNSTTSPSSSIITSAIKALGPDRTLITGDVGSKTGKYIPLSITGLSTFGFGASPMALSSLNQATAQVNSLPCNFNYGPEATELGGRALEPGTYCFSGDIKITGTLTLGGKGMYVFKTTKGINTYYSTAPNTIYSTTTLHNPRKTLVESVKTRVSNEGFDSITGLPPYSIFWVASGDVKIADNTIFLGTVMANNGNISMGEWAEIPQGRLLTRGSISLNKNTIIAPPDPIKLTVTISGDSEGTVTGPNFSCSSKTCQTYYKSGEKVVLTANDVIFSGRATGLWIETEPNWTEGCDDTSGRNCTIEMKNDKSVKVNFNLDTFGGITINPLGWCVNAPGTIQIITGIHGGYYVLKGNIIGGLGLVRGTLEDYNEIACLNNEYHYMGTYRVIEEMKSGMAN